VCVEVRVEVRMCDCVPFKDRTTYSYNILEN